MVCVTSFIIVVFFLSSFQINRLFICQSATVDIDVTKEIVVDSYRFWKIILRVISKFIDESWLSLPPSSLLFSLFLSVYFSINFETARICDFVDNRRIIVSGAFKCFPFALESLSFGKFSYLIRNHWHCTVEQSCVSRWFLYHDGEWRWNHFLHECLLSSSKWIEAEKRKFTFGMQILFVDVVVVLYNYVLMFAMLAESVGINCQKRRAKKKWVCTSAGETETVMSIGWQ